MKNLVYHHIFFPFHLLSFGRRVFAICLFQFPSYYSFMFDLLLLIFHIFFLFSLFSLISRFFRSFDFALLRVLNALTYVRSACNPSFHKNSSTTHIIHTVTHGARCRCRYAIAITIVYSFHGPLKLFFVFSLPRSDHWIYANWPPIDWRKPEKFSFQNGSETIRRRFDVSYVLKNICYCKWQWMCGCVMGNGKWIHTIYSYP